MRTGLGTFGYSSEQGDGAASKRLAPTPASKDCRNLAAQCQLPILRKNIIHVNRLVAEPYGCAKWNKASQRSPTDKSVTPSLHIAEQERQLDLTLVKLPHDRQ